MVTDYCDNELNILIGNVDDRTVCRRALGAAQLDFSSVMMVEKFDTPTLVESETSENVLRGLADIALGKYGERGFSGLRQEQADQLIGKLSGDVEYFFYPILAAAERD
jgi:hypothetical protein